MIANLGWKAVVPAEMPTLLGWVRGEVQGATWEAKAGGVGPAWSCWRPSPRLAPSPAARFALRLPRAAVAPVAQKQSPNQGSHQCAPPAPPPATAALPMLLAPLWSTVPLPRPGAARRTRGRASGSQGSLASDSAPPPLPKAPGQGARSRRWLGTQRKSATP